MNANRRDFAFQIQFSNNTKNDVDRIVSGVANMLQKCGGINLETRTVAEDDSGIAVNIMITADDYMEFWHKARDYIKSPQYKNDLSRMIVTCEGDRGWHNYLLLHTYVDGEEVDII